LQLVERPPDVGFLVGSVLELDHRQGQAVDEQHDVGPPLAAFLDHGELVDRQKVVVVGGVVVQHADQVAAEGAISALVLDRHAFDQIAVDGVVVGDQ